MSTDDAAQVVAPGRYRRRHQARQEHTGDSAELREQRRRIGLLEQDEVLREQRRISRRRICREKALPARKELAADGIPVAVTCRYFKLARQPYYRWRPIPSPTPNSSRLTVPTRCSTPKDDPEFGYRFLVEEAREAGEPMAGCAWRICSQSTGGAFGKKRQERQSGSVGARRSVERDFTADAPNQLWLSDITEHRTDEGKLYLCAIKDVFSNRIVGYSIDSRMKSGQPPQRSVVARRGEGGRVYCPPPIVDLSSGQDDSF